MDRQIFNHEMLRSLKPVVPTYAVVGHVEDHGVELAERIGHHLENKEKIHRFTFTFIYYII